MNAPAKPRLDFPLVAIHALDHLPRVLAGMGFSAVAGPLPRGGLPRFQPRYERFSCWLARYSRTDSIASRGATSGAFTPENVAHLDQQDAAERDEAADRNRARSCYPAYLCARGAPDPVAAYVCSVTGQWSTTTAQARGDDLISLGAMMWVCGLGRSAYRIAKLCGLEAVPKLKEDAHAT